MENVQKLVMELLNNIAEKLGVATEFLYPIMVKQAIIEGALALIYVIIGTSILILTYRFWRKEIIKVSKNEETIIEDEDVAWLLIVVTIILSIFSIFIITINLDNAIYGLFNPDWYVFNDILGDLINKIK